MVTLIILDGFGLSNKKFGNAIKAAGTPYLDKLKKLYPYTTLQASGGAVGLPDGLMGNSEAGHLTIGCGKTILQDLKLIDSEIENGNFFTNPALDKAMHHAEKNKSNLHIMGILSDGRVHSDIAHLFAMLDLAKKYNIKNIYIHVFTDGRDCGLKSANKYLDMLNDKIAGTNAKIGTLVGRVLLDREKNYKRVEKMYNLLVHGKGEEVGSAKQAVELSYQRGITDEFIEPFVIDKDSMVSDNDSLIFFNYRTDREREITYAFTDPNFKEFKAKKFKNFLYTQMTVYADDLVHLNTVFPPKSIDSTLASTLSQQGKTQFHIAETTKYMHVTYFFNGMVDAPYKGEERKLINTIDTDSYAYHPKMKAIEITEETLDAIASQKYDFILVNYSNPDMVGHTGNFEATKQAISCVEKQAYALALATIMAGGDCIITADHGNAEEMIDAKGNPITSHTTNPVPFILASEKYKKLKLKKHGTLANIAPTILKLMKLDIPKSMEQPLF